LKSPFNGRQKWQVKLISTAEYEKASLPEEQMIHLKKIDDTVTPKQSLFLYKKKNFIQI